MVSPTRWLATSSTSTPSLVSRTGPRRPRTHTNTAWYEHGQSHPFRRIGSFNRCLIDRRPLTVPAMSAVSYRHFTGRAAENYQRDFVPLIATPVSETLLSAADLRPGERVLDIACGTGHVTRAAAEAVGSTGAVDGCRHRARHDRTCQVRCPRRREPASTGRSAMPPRYRSPTPRSMSRYARWA